MSSSYIGILGGMGYRATLLAYEKLNQKYELKVGKGHSCPIRLTSIDFHEINELLPIDMDKASDLLLPHLLDLDNQQVVATFMVNNTLHEAFDAKRENITLKKPFGHVGELLRARLQDLNPQRIMILGTMYTMNSSFFEGYIPYTIEVVKADHYIQQKLEELRIQYFEKQNTTLAESCYNLLIQSYPQVDHFVVACTEHSIAFAPYSKDIKWIDTLDLQCEFAVNFL